MAWSSYYGTDNKVICYKFGRVVFIYVRGLPGNTSAAYTVPTQYTPIDSGVVGFSGKAQINTNSTIDTLMSGTVWDQIMFLGRA